MIKKINWPVVWLLILLSFFSCALFSCDCNYHLNKARNKCGSTVTRDTIIVRDTIRVPAVTTHSAFYYNQHDTVIIKEGRLTMKYFYSKDTVFLQGKCDTVYKIIEKRVPTETTQLNFDVWDWVKERALGIVTVLIGIYLLIREFNRYRNEKNNQKETR